MSLGSTQQLWLHRGSSVLPISHCIAAGTAASCMRKSKLCVLTSVRKLILKPVVLLVLGCPLFR